MQRLLKKKWNDKILYNLEFKKASDALDVMLDVHEEDYDEYIIDSLPINVLEEYLIVQATDVKTNIRLEIVTYSVLFSSI